MKTRRHSNEELVKIYIDNAELRANALPTLDEEGNVVSTEYRVEGYAVVFNSPTTITDWWGDEYTEEIAPTALNNTDMRDVCLFFNHDTYNSVPLARTSNGKGTLTLTVDERGLKISAPLDCDNNTQAKAIYSAIERGDITGMSFAFRVKDQAWTGLDSDNPVRYIKDISIIHEVSIVTYPAYKDTSINARSDNNGGNQLSPLEEARNAYNALLLEKEKTYTYFK